jgi:hypothetical protein
MSSELYQIEILERENNHFKIRIEDIHGDLSLPEKDAGFILAEMMFNYEYQLPTPIYDYYRKQQFLPTFGIVATEAEYTNFLENNPESRNYFEWADLLFGKKVDSNLEEYAMYNKYRDAFFRYKPKASAVSYQIIDGVRHYYYYVQDRTLFYQNACKLVHNIQTLETGWVTKDYTQWGIFSFEIDTKIAFLVPNWKAGDIWDTGMCPF